MNDAKLWVLGFLAVVGVLVFVVFVLERSRSKHQTIGEAAQDQLTALAQERDKLRADLLAAYSKGMGVAAEQTNKFVASHGLQTDYDKVKVALQFFQAKGADLETFFKRLWDAQVMPDGRLVFPPAGDVAPAPTIDTQLRSDPGTTSWQLPATFIDRDDLMKHITTDFPQPVILDGKPVHNGLGEALEYWSWPDGGGIRNTKPIKPVKEPQ